MCDGAVVVSHSNADVMTRLRVACGCDMSSVSVLAITRNICRKIGAFPEGKMAATDLALPACALLMRCETAYYERSKSAGEQKIVLHKSDQ